MPRMRVVRISFGEDGSFWVFWTDMAQRKKRRFGPSNMTEALGFAWGLQREKRDQPCILLPPNALVHPDPNIAERAQWETGVKQAEQELATVT